MPAPNPDTETPEGEPARAENGAAARSAPSALFSGITDPLLADTLRDCPIRTYADGDILLTPGQDNHSLYYLLSGELKIYLDEKQQSFGKISPGECVGEMSIITHRPVSAYVVARGPCDVQIIPEDRFWQLLGAIPALVKNLLALLIDRIRSSDQATLKRLYERLALENEMQIARSIQASLLLTTFDAFPRHGVDVYAIMEPLLEVGGDFYDVFLVTPTRLFICIGDVVGKGITAALFMVQSLTLLRMEAMRNIQPGSILESVNRMLYEKNKTNMFVTVFCGILDTETGTFTYANGGHNPPLSDALTGRFEPIAMPGGIALGILDDFRYDNASLTLGPGRSLVAYTDGVTDAENGQGAFFSEARLHATVNRHIGKDSQALIEAIRQEVLDFSHNVPLTDDVTLIAFRYGRPSIEYTL